MFLLLSISGRDTNRNGGRWSQSEHRADGRTRSRINLFMNKFRKKGFIDYNSEDGLTVHRGLLGVLRD